LRYKKQKKLKAKAKKKYFNYQFYDWTIPLIINEIPLNLNGRNLMEHQLKKNLMVKLLELLEWFNCPCRELSVVTSEYVESAVFHTDGSLIGGSAGFTIHQTGVGGFGLKLLSSAGVFSAELSVYGFVTH
jgi:hypothetical protein